VPGPPLIWLVLPTFDEADNIEAMVAAARANLPARRRILIVDDSSPDGTGKIADRLAAEHEELEVLHRPRKEGLGPAYLAGFRAALAGGADLILQMDSDFSHDPGDLPRLLAEAAEADLVIGSRYVRGGRVREWGPLRRAISRGGSLYARVMLGGGVRDLTGGFKCFRRTVLEAMDLDAVGARGYAFQIEMTYRAIRAGFRVSEIPITFRDRRNGRSKMSRAIMAEAIWRVPDLRLESRRHSAAPTLKSRADRRSGLRPPAWSAHRLQSGARLRRGTSSRDRGGSRSGARAPSHAPRARRSPRPSR
jgi:dolichol-phosphate mannosyltransferase